MATFKAQELFLMEMDGLVAKADAFEDYYNKLTKEQKSLYDSFSVTGNFKIENYGLNKKTYLKILDPVLELLGIQGFKTEFSYSSYFGNERLFVSIDKEFLRDYILYNELSMCD